MKTSALMCGVLTLLPPALTGRGDVVLDTSIGTGSPPATLGGRTVGGFPADGRAPGSYVPYAVPPASAPVGGNLQFSAETVLYRVGPNPGDWNNGWSHGYTGNVYHRLWDGAGGSTFAQLDLALPTDTLSLYFYLQPDFFGAVDWGFEVSAMSVGGKSASTSMVISGGNGAKYVGLYTDDPADALQSVAIRMTTEEFLGFGIGEFGINVRLIPESGAWALLTATGLVGFTAWRRLRPHREA